MSSFLFDASWKILLIFFKAIVSLFAIFITSFTGWFGTEFYYFIISWGASFSVYGIFIPVIFVASVAVSIMGCYLVFVFYDGVDSLVGGGD